MRPRTRLQAGGKRDGRVVEGLVDGVGDRPVVVERGEYALERRHRVGKAADVEESLLLTGEGRIRQVFGGGAGAHRDRHAVVASGNSRYAWAISASICFGKDVASIQPRMSAPQR